MNRRCSILVFAALTLGATAHAQWVLGISAIGITTQYVHTYSATEMDYYTAYYYTAAAEHILWQDNTIVEYSYQYGDSYDPQFGGYGIHFEMWYSTQVNHRYYLATNHGIYAYYVYYDPYSECYCDYADPYGYSLLGGTQREDGNGSYISAPDEAEYPTYSGYYLGYTDVVDTSYTPSIDHISVSGTAARGSSGTVRIYGSELAKDAGPSSVAISGAGVSTTVTYQDYYYSPGEVDISYTIASNAATGNRSLTLTTPFGTSNAVTFNVADPTPVISSITPSTWYAGTSYPNVIISGTGFGSNPSVAIDASGVSFSIQGQPTDSQITLQLSVDPNAADQSNVPVRVTSNGYGGNSFFQNPQNPQPNQGQGHANVAAVQLKIYRTQQPNNAPDSDVTGSTLNVIVGERIAIEGRWQGSTATPFSPQWTLPSSQIGGFATQGDPNHPTSGSVTSATTNQTNTVLFFVIPANVSLGSPYNASATYQANEGVNGAQYSATVSFNIATTNPSFGQFSQPATAIVVNDDCAPAPTNMPTALHYGGCPGHTTGIQLVTTTSDSSGQFHWVQIVQSSDYHNESQSILNCSGLDNNYPYDQNPSILNGTPFTSALIDSPGVGVIAAHSFYHLGASFFSYLMFKPNIDQAIFVPIGRTTWGITGEAQDSSPSPSTWQSFSTVDYVTTRNVNPPSLSRTQVFPQWSNLCTNH